MFSSPRALAALYPKLLRGAIGAFGAEQLMRDLRARLYGAETSSDPENRRRRGRVTRHLRLLPAHGLIRKVPHTHRYVLTGKGRCLTSAILQTKNIPVTEVTRLAA